MTGGRQQLTQLGGGTCEWCLQASRTKGAEELPTEMDDSDQVSEAKT